MEFLWVGLGSGLGGMTRHGVGLLAAAWLGKTFPYGTLVVNLLGSFLIALVGSLILARPGALNQDVTVFLTVGVFGGLTTYSSFNEQTLALFRDAGFGPAALNVGLTLAGCAIAGLAGFYAGSTIGE